MNLIFGIKQEKGMAAAAAAAAAGGEGASAGTAGGLATLDGNAAVARNAQLGGGPPLPSQSQAAANTPTPKGKGKGKAPKSLPKSKGKAPSTPTPSSPQADEAGPSGMMVDVDLEAPVPSGQLGAA
jgi:hypothetical protein